MARAFIRRGSSTRWPISEKNVDEVSSPHPFVLLLLSFTAVKNSKYTTDYEKIYTRLDCPSECRGSFCRWPEEATHEVTYNAVCH